MSHFNLQPHLVHSHVRHNRGGQTELTGKEGTINSSKECPRRHTKNVFRIVISRLRLTIVGNLDIVLCTTGVIHLSSLLTAVNLQSTPVIIRTHHPGPTNMVRLVTLLAITDQGLHHPRR